MLTVLPAICGKNHQHDQPQERPHDDGPKHGGRRRQLPLGLAQPPAAVELLGQLGAAREAVVRIRLQAAGDRALQRHPSARQTGAAGRLRRRAGRRPSARSVSTIFSFALRHRERHLAFEQLLQHQAERVDVGPRGDGFGLGRVARVERIEMFGRHVGERAAEHFVAARFAADWLRRNIEVGQHRPAVWIHQNVGRLDVAMQHAVAMGEIERLGQPRAEPGRGFDGVHARERFAVVQRGGVELGGQRGRAVDDRQQLGAVPFGRTRRDRLPAYVACSTPMSFSSPMPGTSCMHSSR